MRVKIANKKSFTLLSAVLAIVVITGGVFVTNFVSPPKALAANPPTGTTCPANYTYSTTGNDAPVNTGAVWHANACNGDAPQDNTCPVYGGATYTFQQGITVQIPNPYGNSSSPGQDTCYGPPAKGASTTPAPKSQADCNAQAQGQIYQNGACVPPQSQSDCDKAIPNSTFQQGAYQQKSLCVGGAVGSNTNNTSGSADGPQLQCTTSILNPLTWLVCPIVSAAQSAVNQLNNGIDSLLTINTGKNSVFDTSSCAAVTSTTPASGNTGLGCGFKDAWNNFRSLSIGIIIIGGLLMVIAQAAGMEFLDAYTVRKVLPRLLIAAIFITLSWYILAFFIQLTNDIGNSIRAVIYQPFMSISTGGISLNTDSLLVTNLIGGVGILALGLVGLGTFAITALLAVLVGFVVLVVRNLVILLLIIVAPLAIACYVLPNTQKAWTFWKDTLISMLVVFPIISAFIAVGRVFAIVAYSSNGTANGSAFIDHGSGVGHGFAVLAYHLGFGATAASPGLLATIEAFVAYFLPYFLLPFAFRLAGGAIGTIAGLANDKGRGGFDRLKGFRQKRMQQNMSDLKTGNRIKSDNFMARRFNATSKGIANVPNAGINPFKMRSRMQAAGATHEASEMGEYMEKNAAFGAIKGNDDYLQATMKNMGGGENESDWRRYLQSKHYEGRALEQGVAQIRAAKRDVSSEVFQKSAVMANASTGTGWKEGGVPQMMESIMDASGGDRHTAMTMLAGARGAATNAGRLDLAGSGFGTQATQLNKMFDEKEKTGRISDATKTNVKHALHANLLETKGPGEFARARGQAVQQIAPEMVYDLEQYHNKVGVAETVLKSTNEGSPQYGAAQKAVSDSKRELAQKYASIANLHDSLNHMAPENAKIIADGVLAKQIAPGVTVMDQIQRYQQAQDPGYLQTRKDYDARQYREQGNGGQPFGDDGYM